MPVHGFIVGQKPGGEAPFFFFFLLLEENGADGRGCAAGGAASCLPVLPGGAGAPGAAWAMRAAAA